MCLQQLKLELIQKGDQHTNDQQQHDKRFYSFQSVSKYKLTLRIGELNNNIIFKDVNFFNSWNGVNSNSLQGALKLLVISCIGLVHSLLLSAVTERSNNSYNKN